MAVGGPANTRDVAEYPQAVGATAQVGPTSSWPANEVPHTSTIKTVNFGYVDLKRELRVDSLSEARERVCEEW